MMKKETLNTLILRHGDRMLRQAGWPDTVDMAPVAPETVPAGLPPAALSVAWKSSRLRNSFVSR